MIKDFEFLSMENVTFKWKCPNCDQNNGKVEFTSLEHDECNKINTVTCKKCKKTMEYFIKVKII